MKFNKLKTKYKDLILAIAEKRKIDNVRIFGSIARKQENKRSDIDFLVHLQPNADLLDLSGFHLDLEKLLNCKVDVIPDNAIHWSIKDRIFISFRVFYDIHGHMDRPHKVAVFILSVQMILEHRSDLGRNGNIDLLMFKLDRIDPRWHQPLCQPCA